MITKVVKSTNGLVSLKACAAYDLENSSDCLSGGDIFWKWETSLCAHRRGFGTIGGSDAASQNPRCDLRDYPLTPGERNDQGHQLLRRCSQDHKPVTLPCGQGTSSHTALKRGGLITRQAATEHCNHGKISNTSWGKGPSTYVVCSARRIGDTREILGGRKERGREWGREERRMEGGEEGRGKGRETRTA